MANNPLNQLKDESYYRKKVLPKIFDLVKKKVCAEMEEAQKIAFTTDTWSEGTNAFIRLDFSA